MPLLAHKEERLSSEIKFKGQVPKHIIGMINGPIDKKTIKILKLDSFPTSCGSFNSEKHCFKT
jgi:hypothetical protein